VTTALLALGAYVGRRLVSTVDENRKRTDYLLGVRGVGDNDGRFGELEEQLKESRVAREEDRRELEDWLGDLDERLDHVSADLAAIRHALNRSDDVDFPAGSDGRPRRWNADRPEDTTDTNE
jgi:hypothetical protein